MLKKALLIIILVSMAVAANADGPKRIVSLSPGITEILYSLGMDDRVIGVTANCDYPPAANKNEKVGLFLSPNLEKIVSLKPDLVLAPDAGHRALAKLNELGIRTVIMPARNISEILEDIRVVGAFASREASAEALSLRITDRIETVKNEISAFARPKVLAVVWINRNEVMSAGKSSFINELIDLAGGENILASVEAEYPVISPEYIVGQNPDVVVFVDTMSDAGLLNAMPGIGGINAVKNGRIYTISDPNTFLRPGPRLADGLEEIAKLLHPEISTKK